jgi:rare lipoprotein A
MGRRDGMTRFIVKWRSFAAGAAPLPSSPKLAACLAFSALLCGCAGQPARDYVRGAQIDPRYGVRPSPRVVAEGEEVPEGGGHYQLGKPYQIAGKTYYPSEKPYKATGLVSWYGSDFHGRLTANGEIFDRNAAFAAHPTMPLPSYARVTNTANGYSMVVRVNDRGPYHGGRVMDVSQRVAESLDFYRAGTARVKVEWLGRADVNGGDKAMLLASVRTDGRPASLPPRGGPVTQFAERARDSVVAAVEEGEDRLSSVVDRRPEPVAVEEEEGQAPTPPRRPDVAQTQGVPVNAPLPPTRPFALGRAPTKSSHHTKLAQR